MGRALEELKHLERRKAELEQKLRTVKGQIEETRMEMGEKDIPELTRILEETTWSLDAERFVRNCDKDIARATTLSEDSLGDAMSSLLEGCYDEVVSDWSMNKEEGVEFEIGDAPTLGFDCEDFGFDINDLTSIMYALDVLAELKLNVTFGADTKESMLSQLDDIRKGINRIIRIVRSGKFFRRNRRGR